MSDSQNSPAGASGAPQSDPGYDQSPYVPPTAPPYDTTPYPPALHTPTPTYTPPSYPASSYTNSGYPAPPLSPVQTTPGAPPVMPYSYGGYAPAPKTNGLAVASLVLSIAGFVWLLPLVGSILGIVMGHISLARISRTGEGGRGMALAGAIIGWAGVGLVLLIVGFITIVVVSGVGSGRYA